MWVAFISGSVVTAFKESRVDGADDEYAMATGAGKEGKAAATI